MKKRVTMSSERQQFWTFLIRKSKDGRMGLWFVFVLLQGPDWSSVRKPVWRKIQDNGRPKDLGAYGSLCILGGDIRLLGEDDAGPNEKACIMMITGAQNKHALTTTTGKFSSREKFFQIYSIAYRTILLQAP